jgi:hypothetical protein
LKLPNGHLAYIPPEKLTDYLLSADHPDGRHKAVLFERFGFDEAELRQTLLNLAASEDVVSMTEGARGTSFVIAHLVPAPKEPERLIPLKSIWFIDRDASRPRLVTAYIDKAGS